uniref:Uncharacterized protein n=1 Tax=Panagrolaimus sp. JU765 TaxID=591449 RepID=A0AC34PUR1_9BILA
MADMKKIQESNQQHNQSFVGKTEVSDSNARPATGKPLIFPKSKSEPNSPNKKIESATDRNLSSLFFPSLNYGEPVKVEKDEKDEIKKIKKHMSDDDEEIVIIQESSASNTSKTALVDSSAETVHSKRRKKPRIDPPAMMANPTPTMPPVVFNYVPAPQPLNPPPLWDMIIHFPPILAKDRLKFE